LPSTPDSLNVKSVQVDAPSGQPFDEPMTPTVDGFKAAAVFIVESGKDDILAAIWRDGSDMRLRDENNTGSGVTLTDLVGGVSPNKWFRHFLFMGS
jgi:hypothetical protein